MSVSLLLPLDGRPCNARFPVELAALADHAVKTPALELLGSASQPANLKQLDQWIESEAPTAHKLFLSLDTWLYGNLVASRKSTQPLPAVLERLQQLQLWAARWPELEIHAFATLLRLSNSQDATEERPYWAQHGKQIYRFAWLEHALQTQTDARWQAEYNRLETVIPAAVLQDYRALRLRNFTVLESLIGQMAVASPLKTLLIGCDDGGEYGWTVQEREKLKAQVAAIAVSEQCLIYPGADELAAVLLARVLVPEHPRLEVHWSNPQTQHLQTRYEGLPLQSTLSYQAQAVGVELALEPDSTAQAVLWLHNPNTAPQIDQFLERQQHVPFDPEQVQPLLACLRGTRPVGLADLRYANGGDAELLKWLEAQNQLFQLSAYAGWNTNGNSLGLLLAWLKFRLHKLAQPQKQLRFLIERLADDGWYQGYLRQQLCQDYRDPVHLGSCLQAIAWFNDCFRRWQSQLPADCESLQVKQLTFPWKRFFELHLQVCFRSATDDLAAPHRLE